MARIIALDIGSGFTKCFDGKRKIIFPSIYSYRQPNLWEENSDIIEGIGESALEISQHPNSVTLYPVIDGIPQHSAYIKLAEEALSRLRIHFCMRFFRCQLCSERDDAENNRLDEPISRQNFSYSIEKSRTPSTILFSEKCDSRHNN